MDYEKLVKRRERITKLTLDAEQADIKDIVKDISKNKLELEKQFFDMCPYSLKEIQRMIVDYTNILDEYHNKATDKSALKKQRIENMITAAYMVGFTSSHKIDAKTILPMFALAGINDTVGKAVRRTYLRELKKMMLKGED